MTQQRLRANAGAVTHFHLEETLGKSVLSPDGGVEVEELRQEALGDATPADRNGGTDEDKTPLTRMVLLS